ncbi:MAG TPA: hypothetical protein VNI20_08460, partial [Fimbriimonadaceae bacterium]|nr:hypothetical protein [Fimbriimonadaceae bacterium]
LYCPLRFDADCSTVGNKGGRCYGYGFNWGFYNPWDDGIGLLNPQQQGVNREGFKLVGKTESQVTQPAKTFLFGDTWATPDYTLAVFTNWNGPGSARHFGHFNFVYVDGHAKSVPMRHGVTDPDEHIVGNVLRTHFIDRSDTLSPASDEDLKSYCSDVSGEDCTAIVNWFLKHTTFDYEQ